MGSVAGAEVAVGGFAAESKDFNDEMKSVAPYVFGFVLAFAFLLMLVAFRSIVIAVKAILLNLLSVAAAYGILVLVFQHGWGKQLLGFEATGGIVPILPIFLFVILFGLSMDYHVFILSRIREAYDRGMSTEQAIAHGIKTTAGVITSAAIVMVCVFSIFAVLSFMLFKQIGVGLAAAILIDATIVRAVLLPATMKLLGDWNWYLPKWLEWLPHLEPNGDDDGRGAACADGVVVTEAASHPLGERAHSEVWARIAAERVLAIGALALVALHVIDDSFLQPEPGTSAADHLVSGLVPVALIAGAAALYGRARAGVRATLALLFGFFGVLSGTEAVYYSLNGGPSGDDFTGFLSIVGGFVLLGIGIAILWRSRRTDDSRLRRYLRRAAITVGVLVLVTQVLFPTAIAYVVTHTARAEVPTPNLGAAHEEVAFTTSDGLELQGWFVPSRNGATVIAFPGRSGPQKQTRMLVATRLRRPPLRPTRRGRERRRSEHLRLARRARPARCRGVSAQPFGCRSRADWRDRPLRRWRDADPGSGGIGRFRGHRLRRRERSVGT